LEEDGVLGAHYPDSDASGYNFESAFKDEKPPDVGRAGIDRLIDKGRRPPEVD